MLIPSPFLRLTYVSLSSRDSCLGTPVEAYQSAGSNGGARESSQCSCCVQPSHFWNLLHTRWTIRYTPAKKATTARSPKGMNLVAPNSTSKASELVKHSTVNPRAVSGRISRITVPECGEPTRAVACSDTSKMVRCGQYSCFSRSLRCFSSSCFSFSRWRFSQ